MPLRMLRSGRLDAKKPVSHRFELTEIMKAYKTFGNAAKKRAIKVIVKNKCGLRSRAGIWKFFCSLASGSCSSHPLGIQE